MHNKDGFMKRIRSLKRAALAYDRSERFKGRNPHSLGFLVYSQDETELMRSSFGERADYDLPERPDTKLARRRGKKREKEIDRTVLDAVERLFQALTASDKDGNQTIEINELRIAFNTSIGDFSEQDALLLFGHKDVERAFEQLDEDGDGKISFDELAMFISSKGINFNSFFLGYNRKKITNWREFLGSVHVSRLLCRFTECCIVFTGCAGNQRQKIIRAGKRLR
eukprot:m.88947 g.88947  ORF g.88947 m.88947 type:complete len:225 (+) comp36589_c0_seq17:1125-1799(+)